jgi:hypothetical protein
MGPYVSEKKNRTLTDDDLKAVADAVLDGFWDVIRTELTKLVWDGIRKVVIAGALMLWGWGQLQHFLK